MLEGKEEAPKGGGWGRGCTQVILREGCGRAAEASCCRGLWQDLRGRVVISYHPRKDIPKSQQNVQRPGNME